MKGSAGRTDRTGGAEGRRGPDAAPRLGPEQIRFERTDGGLVRAILADGTRHEAVDFYRAFPFSAPDDLVAVHAAGGAALGMLAPLDTFTADERRLIDEELRRRYFAPWITAVNSLKERFGRSHWEVETEAGPARFEAQNEHANLRDLPDGTLLLLDVNGNRYRLAPRSELPPRVRRRLEAMF